MIAREIFCLLQGVLDVAIGAPGLRLLEPALRLLQALERLSGLGAGCLLTVRGGPAHRVRGVAQLPRRLHEIGAVFFTRQLLEPARGFFRLVGQIALRLPRSIA